MFNYYFRKYQNPSDMYKKLHEIKDKKKKNEDQVYSVKKILDKIKKTIKMCLKINHLRLKETKR